MKKKKSFIFLEDILYSLEKIFKETIKKTSDTFNN